MWREEDPTIFSLLQKSLRDYRHELLVGNCLGIPLMLQHGGADDNVPPFHSRRMNQLISQSAETPPLKYVELTGKGHWFDGVMTTTALRKFYAKVLSDEKDELALPLNFSITIANPADMGSRGGLIVDQLRTPDGPGKIDVKRDISLNTWTLRTSNVQRFHFTSCKSTGMPSQVEVDHESLILPIGQAMMGFWLTRSESGIWQVIVAPQTSYPTS